MIPYLRFIVYTDYRDRIGWLAATFKQAIVGLNLIIWKTILQIIAGVFQISILPKFLLGITFFIHIHNDHVVLEISLE